jgi:hypothetical protein
MPYQEPAVDLAEEEDQASTPGHPPESPVKILNRVRSRVRVRQPERRGAANREDVQGKAWNQPSSLDPPEHDGVAVPKAVHGSTPTKPKHGISEPCPQQRRSDREQACYDGAAIHGTC